MEYSLTSIWLINHPEFGESLLNSSIHKSYPPILIMKILFVGTYDNGLYQIKNNTIQQYDGTNGLSSNHINSLYYASDKTLWIGTKNGYNTLSAHGIFSFNEDDGLIHNEIQCIIEDKKGVIWMGTLGGLVRIDGINYRDFDEEEGLYDLSINALVSDVQGNIWIGTFGGGLYRYMQVTDSVRPIEKVADEQLLHSNNIYSLCFYDSSILIAGTDKGFCEVVLTGLKSGKYTLEARVLSNNQFYSDASVYHFVITPPFWKTYWFYSLVLVIVLVTLVVYIKYRERKLKQEKVKLEKAVKERTREIEKQKDMILEQNDDVLVIGIRI